ncbi:MAG: MBL fold metallo-hydrolase [Bacilli bacterium]
MKIVKGTEHLSHTYILTRFNQAILIDPSYDLKQISEYLSDRTLVGVLLTHAHRDHIDLIGHFNVPVYIHREDAHLLFEDKHNGYEDSKRPYNKKNLDLVLVEDEERILFADHYIEVMHTPGHTKGSVCYLYHDQIFTGDTLFKNTVGRHDLYSGSLPELKRSILKILSLNANHKIYPGHDEFSTVRYEKANNPFYLKWIKQLKK